MNVPSLIVGIGSLLAGMDALKKAFDDEPKRRRRQLGDGVSTGDKMQVKTYTVHDIAQRVGYIIQMIRKGRDNPTVRQRTVQILSQKCGREWCVPEKDWPAEVEAIFKAVREHIRYTRDTYGKDLFQHPVRTFQFGGADCDDYTIVLGSMLQSVGYPVRARVIRTTDADDWNHIYLLVGLPPRAPARWVPLDASVNKPPGWEAPRSMVADMRDFNVP
jgi:hypothetical protein